jgi:glycosidase
MNRVNDALMLEYPKLTIFGETVSRSVTGTAYFTRNTMDVPFKHNVEGVTDFPVYYSFLDAVNQPFSWDNGLSKLYVTLSQDILYKNPLNNSIFLDNHDNNRFLSMVGEDYNKFKMGIGLLYTTRGIPQLYYGTEILMKNFMNPSDAMVRLNFPGGFPGDAVNKFEASGRNVKENEAFNFVKTIANFRKGSPALTKGSTTMFVPKDGYFVYFRKADNQTIMCVVNSNDKAQDVQFSDYAELTNGFKGGKEVVTGYQVGTQFSIPAKQIWIIELNK